MASSNRHWPSMFKSNPTNTNHHHHQWPQPHDHKNPYTPEAVQAGNEARAPEPKPRWNPRPEQIRTLEAIFNSGTVNPSRDEIRRIRVQLQEYGQVGDANIFYWFQNRKSRIKQKQRQLLQNYKPRLTNQAAAAIAPASSSSSSSSSNNSNYEKALPIGSASVVDLLNKNNNNNYNKSSRRSNNSPTVSVDQPTLFQALVDFPTEPSFSLGLTQGFCLPESVGNCSSANLMNELILMSDGLSKKDEDEDVEKMKMKEHLIASPSLLGETRTPKTTVFINDVCFEIGNGPFNVRETFGDDAVLIHSAGQPVLTNEWGLTQQPLQHGMFYYLIRAFNRSPDHGKIV